MSIVQSEMYEIRNSNVNDMNNAYCECLYKCIMILSKHVPKVLTDFTEIRGYYRLIFMI